MLPEESEFLRELYNENFPALYRYAVKLLKLSNFDSALFDDLAEELVQDTFHTASEKIKDLTVHPNPGGWLMIALKNKFREFRRRARSDNRQLILMSALTSDLADPRSNIGAAQSDMELRGDLARIRQALSPEDLSLFEMVALNHVSHRSAAEKLGISVWASQKRLERIRKSLRDIVAP